MNLPSSVNVDPIVDEVAEFIDFKYKVRFYSNKARVWESLK